MAQVQRQPSFPISNFLGRPEHRSLSGPALPPIQTSRATASHQLEGRTLPPIQLAPVRSPHGAGIPPGQSLGKVSTISQLLSQSSPPQTRAQPAPLQQSAYYPQPSNYGGMRLDHRAPEQPIHIQPPGSYGGYPQDHRPQQAYTHPVAPRFDQPHPQRHLQEMYRNEPPSHTRYPSSSEPDRAEYSPAVTCRSSVPSYYDPEPSPRTPIAPTSVPTERPRVNQPLPLEYKLIIRQQPVAARACGFGERDRRVIDPPPILELKITDRKTGHPESDWNAMLALHCTLLSPDGRDDETEVPPQHPEMLSTRRLMGTLVASPYPAKDENGVAGTFFVFPDLSCRSPGKYRLRFNLLRIDPMMMQPGVSSPSVATVTTDVFNVYTAKDFPGMRASSALLKSLRRQGLNVGVKKGSEARKGKGKTKKENSSSEEEDDDSDRSDQERRGSGGTGGTKSTGGVSPKSKPTKQKAKRKRRESGS
ncbi:hypothetical protein LTR36_001753 [Oleoguttula mirabilis]|uniref:Velvet domain-containing protein n=1 Tax=Oleoguttula mirabilis TaxID=1507867 RepID=A0AAV9JMI3_9PEZI|nr:hypothetical protein LTR36_001753 [Oleoguttula mirabilis]